MTIKLSEPPMAMKTATKHEGRTASGGSDQSGVRPVAGKMARPKKATPKALLKEFARQYKRTTAMGFPHFESDEPATVQEAISQMEECVHFLGEMFNDMQHALDRHIWNVRVEHTDLMGKRQGSNILPVP